MIAQATLDGFFGLFSMPEVFGFWRNLFVKRPVRPELLLGVLIEDYPHPDGQYGVVYPIKRGDDSERPDDKRYAIVWFSGDREKFEEATYFKAEGLAGIDLNDIYSKITTTVAFKFDTKQRLQQEDKAWLVETLQRQRQKPKRKRAPEP